MVILPLVMRSRLVAVYADVYFVVMATTDQCMFGSAAYYVISAVSTDDGGQTGASSHTCILLLVMIITMMMMMMMMMMSMITEVTIKKWQLLYLVIYTVGLTLHCCGHSF